MIIKHTITAKNFIYLLLISLTLLFCMSAVSAADSIYVNTTGNDATGNGSAENPYLTIQKGIYNVNENGTIRIGNGQYSGVNNTNITINKNMNIVGESQTGTIINGTGTNWIFNIIGGVNITICNLTLTNGYTTELGGTIYNEGNLTVTNCTFTGNTADYAGGAITNCFSTLDGSGSVNCTLTGCTFTSNAANEGGAIWNRCIILGSGSGSVSCAVTGCTFTSNRAVFGGAIYNDCIIGGSGTLNCTVTGCTFTNNTVSQDGGAIYNKCYVYSGSGTLNCTTTGCTFTNNQGRIGGAISNQNSNLTAQFNRFVGNTATVHGNTIYNDSGSVDAENNWWGSNNPVWGSLISGFDQPEHWVILSINAAPNSINNTQTSTITANFNHINGGGDLVGGYIPDGPITLQIPWGSFTSTGTTHLITLNTINGVITATFYANEGAVNPLFNPVMVNATADGYTTNDTESAYITINPAADISVNKTFEDTNHNHIISANYQDTVVIHLRVTNNGPDMANWVVINDIIPAELDASSLNITSNALPWGYVYYSDLQNLTLYLVEIANGASYDVWINVTNVGHNNNLITNTASLDTTETYPYDPNHDNNNSTDSYTANAAADVILTKEFRDNPWGNVITTAHYNDKIYAIVRVSNSGPDSTSLSVLDSLTGITWTGTYYVLPYLIPNIQSNWILNDTTNTFNGTHWNIPVIGSGLGGTVKWLAIEGIINQTGTVSNHAETVDQSAYPYAGYNSYTAYLTASAAPTNLTIDNTRGNKDETVTLKAILKDYQGNPLSGKIAEFWVDGVKVGENTTDINGTATFDYIFTQTPGNHTIEAVFNGNTEYLASNITGQLYVPKSDLYLKITSNKKNTKVDETFTITYKLGNNGPDEAKNVTITIPLPEGFEISQITGDGNWTYNANTNTITWTLANVPVGDPYLYISGHVNKPGTYAFSSSISSETYNINSEGVTPITINAVSEVKAASKTIPMQNTGLPIAGLILAILAVIGGLTGSKGK